MADVSAHTPIFSRGSTVLDYWLVHAEGLIVQPIGARVEEVVVGAPIGRAEALIVRSRMTHRLRAIPADSIVAVEPSSGHLLLDATESRMGLRIPRPSPERITAARASSKHGLRVAQHRAIRAARGTHAGTRSILSWTGAGIAWLAPRLAAGARVAGATGARWTLTTVVIVARGAARTARELERAAAAGAERGRASLELRRARQQRTPDE